jgi:membrane protease YdiL (CAAX protease family)
MALFEVFLVCGIPTQVMLLVAMLSVLQMSPHDLDGGISFRFFATLSFADTLLVAVLIRLFLRSNGERPRDVFVGQRPVWPEALRGLALVVPIMVAVTTVVWTLRTLFPWMHTVEQNPLEAFLDSPVEAAVFLVVVVLAGGVREELQRAFVLHRFEQRLGGVRLGLVLFSITFGALHLDQGVDVSVAIGLLGLLWGIIYVRRRSAVLPMVNHAGFNAMQVAQAVLLKSFGG